MSAPVLPDLQLLRRIGRGSYGDVWLARTVTGLYRAVKIVDRARFADARPFQREFDGIVRFQRAMQGRPRQLALLHVGHDEAQGLFYYVMELADDVLHGPDVDPEAYEAATLKAVHARRPIMPVAEVVRIGADLTRSLAELHTAGLIHRDVKPSNIVFVAGVPKLADLGLVSSSDQTLTSLGTPGYTPPEGTGTVRADLFSLGKILYELATGNSPDDFPRLPAEIVTSADGPRLMELNEVLLRASDHDAGKRYPTADALLQDLLLLQAGGSVQEMTRLRRRVRQAGRVALALGAVALVALAGLGVRHYFALRQHAADAAVARARAEADEHLARYTADLHTAQLGVSLGDNGLARSALRRQLPPAGTPPANSSMPDLRGWEWHALWDETAGDQTRIFGAVGDVAVRTLVIAPEARAVAVQTTDGTTALLDPATGARRVLAEKTWGLGGFTSDGAELILGTADRKLRRVSLATGALSPEQAVTGRITAAAGDGRTVLLGELVGTGVRLRVWDAVAEREVGVWESGERPQQLSLSAATLTRDGRKLAVSLFWTEGTVRRRELLIWDVPQARVLGRNESVERLQTLTFSPDGRILAAAMAGRAVTLLDGESAAVVRELEGHTAAVTSLAFSPDGAWLGSGGRDQTVRWWRVDGTGPATAPAWIGRGHEGTLAALQWSPAGDILWSAADDGTVRTWSQSASRPPRVAGGLWTSVGGGSALSPDGAELAVTSQTGQVELRATRTLAVERVLAEAYRPLGYSASGAELHALDRRRRLVRWTRADGQVQPTTLAIEEGGDRAIGGVAFAPGQQRALLGLGNGELRLWDVAAAAELARASEDRTSIYVATIDRSGSLAATVAREGIVRVWSLPELQVRHTWQIEADEVEALAFDPTGTRVAIGTREGAIHVWDLPKGMITQRLLGHSRRVQALLWTNDGSRLVSGSNDGTVVCWWGEGFRRLATLAIPPGSTDRGVHEVQFDATESQVLIITNDGRLLRWGLTP